MSLKSQNWKWWAGDNEENYSIGPCDTRDQAIAEATHSETYEEFQDDDGEQLRAVHIVEATKDDVDLSLEFEADDFMNQASERLSDELAGDGDFEIHDTPADRDDLEVRVRAVISQWQKERGITVSAYRFTASRNYERVVI